MTVDHLVLRGMVFAGKHGAMAWEREVGQPFEVDVRLGVDLKPAGMTDSLRRAVNYGEVYERVRTRVEGPPVHLIETVAERIAADLLAAYPQVATVEVTVKKPQAPVGGPIRYAAAEVLRTRRAMDKLAAPSEVPDGPDGPDGQGGKR